MTLGPASLIGDLLVVSGWSRLTHVEWSTGKLRTTATGLAGADRQLMRRVPVALDPPAAPMCRCGESSSPSPTSEGWPAWVGRLGLAGLGWLLGKAFHVLKHFKRNPSGGRTILGETEGWVLTQRNKVLIYGPLKQLSSIWDGAVMFGR